MNQNRIRRGLQRAAVLLAGNLLLAFDVAAFIIPSNVIAGGATGIGIVLSRVLPLDTASIVFIFNMLMLLLGGVVLGKGFVASTVVSSVLYPLFLSVFQRIPGIDSLTDSVMLSVLFGGGLLGVAVGMIMRIGSSTGGTDVLNLVMHKWFQIPISVCVWAVDIAIIGGQALFAEPERILYGIVLLVLESIVLDQVMVMGTDQIQILAVSAKSQQIRRELLLEIPAGVTMMEIETGCLGQRQQAVMCVIPPRKLHEAMERIQAIDPNVFMTVTKIKEVRGQGFTRERLDRIPAIQEQE